MVSTQPQQPFQGDSKDTNFDVLGIALVVEESGKGARLVFRYPATPPTVPDNNGDHQDSSREDLFFRLPPLVMSKLFRPKKPLCGQPMTINIGGTVFCCRAILFDDDENGNSTRNKESNLVLFCVVVALAPSAHSSSILASEWFDGEEQEKNGENTSVDGSVVADKGSGRFASASFRSIRRVHVSLARLCRVLAREERRCQYVSLQSSILLEMRAKFGLSDTASSTNNTQPPTGSNSSVVTSSQPISSNAVGRHRRMGSGVTSVSGSAADGAGGDGDFSTSEPGAQTGAILKQQELEQEAVEAMLAAQPSEQEGIQSQYPHYGNLARELSRVFHVLSRNNKNSVFTPNSLLSGRDGIVYINRHIAVPIESIDRDSAALLSLPMTHFRGGNKDMDVLPVIRPYHTMLFPHASPSEFMETLPMIPTSLYSPQRLQQLLLMANPRKSVAEIAVDSTLPLPIALEVAAHLASHGACIVSPVLTRSSSFACSHDAIPRMQDYALDFTHHFGTNFSIFMVVSALTVDSMKLGEVMSRVSSPANDEADDDLLHLLGEKIAAALQQQCLPPGLVLDKGSSRRNPYGDFKVAGDSHLDDQSVVLAKDIEEVVYALTVYLRSHLIIVEIKEYLVAIGTVVKYVVSDVSESGLSDSGDSGKGHPAEALYQKLIDADCLGGQVSTTALCWKHNLDSHQLYRFKAWGLRNNRIRVVNRTPTSTDDWGAA